MGMLIPNIFQNPNLSLNIVILDIQLEQRQDFGQCYITAKF